MMPKGHSTVSKTSAARAIAAIFTGFLIMATGLLGAAQAAPRYGASAPAASPLVLASGLGQNYEPDPRLQAQDLRRQQQAPLAPEAYPNLRALTPEQQAESELAYQRAQRSRSDMTNPAVNGFGPDYDPKAPAKPGFYGPPDLSQFPPRFTKELEEKAAAFRSKKMSDKEFQSWSQDFFGRMADWKQKNAKDVAIPPPYPISE